MLFSVMNTWAEAWTAVWAWVRAAAASASLMSVMSPSELVRVVWRSVWVVAAAALTQAQTAVQASAQVFQTLNGLTLLNYISPTTPL